MWYNRFVFLLYYTRGGYYYMGNTNESTVYEDAIWSITLRPRNLTHAGEPDRKVWVSKKGNEVAHFTDKYRGYGHYMDHEDMLDPEISASARKAWEMLKEGPFTPEMLESIRAEVAKIMNKEAES